VQIDDCDGGHACEPGRRGVVEEAVMRAQQAPRERAEQTETSRSVMQDREKGGGRRECSRQMSRGVNLSSPGCAIPASAGLASFASPVSVRRLRKARGYGIGIRDRTVATGRHCIQHGIDDALSATRTIWASTPPPPPPVWRADGLSPKWPRGSFRSRTILAGLAPQACRRRGRSGPLRRRQSPTRRR
jgi:hypothetical protein